MKAAALPVPHRMPALRVWQVALAFAIVLAFAGGLFVALEIHAMRAALDATNVGLARTNEQLAQTNRLLLVMRGQLDDTNGRLASTNRLLNRMRGQLDATNGRLSATNARLSAMAAKIVHAKLLF